MLNFLFTKTPLLLLVQSFWRDEAFSYLLAKKNLVDIVFLTAHDFNPPLYYFLLHFWMKIFSHSEIAIRSLSLIAFWATLYVVFLILTQIFKFKFLKSCLYLLFFIFNPLLLSFALEARMYTLFSFFATLSFYAFYKNKPRLYIISTVLGLYTHYFMIFVVVSQIIYLVFVKLKKNPFRFNARIIFSPFIFFIPWMIFTASQGQYPTSFWIAKTTWDDIPYVPVIIFTGYEKQFHYLGETRNGGIPSLTYFSIALLIVIVLGAFIYRNRVKNKDGFLYNYLFIWAFFTPMLLFFISFVQPIFLPRYFIFSTVGLLLLLIFVFDRFPSILKITVVILLIFYATNFKDLKIKLQPKANFAQTIGEIKKLAKKDDLLYVTSELNYHTAQYYFDENRVYIFGKTYEEIPNYVGKILISQSAIATSLPRYPKKAFILKDDLTYNIQAIY